MSEGYFVEVIIADLPIRCAYAKCQVGAETQDSPPPVQSAHHAALWYHPGCYADEMRRGDA